MLAGLVVVLLLYLASTAQNPCFDREWNVADCTPVMVRELCAYCPLDADNVQDVTDPKPGHFKDCNQLYNIDSSSCQWAFLQYIKRTSCDHATRNAYYAYYHGKNETCIPDDRTGSCEYDEINRAVLERLVYTNCELCCDCIGCGEHSSQAVEGDDLLPLFPTRRNCPLHFYYDNCAHFPDQQFEHPESGKMTRLCDPIFSWFQSGQQLAGGNPELDNEIYPILQAITEKAWGCNLPGAWWPCKALETKQGRLTVGHVNC